MRQFRKHHSNVNQLSDFLFQKCKVEKQWCAYKLLHHINARNSDYESKYRDFLQRQYPETWTSFRHFEATRVLYNHACRLGILSALQSLCSKYCNFLDPEFGTQDTTIAIMKDILSTCIVGFGALVGREQQVVALELLLMCVRASVFCQSDHDAVQCILIGPD